MRYKYSQKEMDELKKSFVLVYDTREQENAHILEFAEKKAKMKTKKKKLDYGDYTVMIPKNEKLGIYRDVYLDDVCTVERKGSIDELAGNLTNGRTRFEEELQRSRGKILLLIEGSREDIIKHNYRSKYEPKSYLNTLDVFEHRYNIGVDFQSKELASSRLIRWLVMGAREYLKFNLVIAE